MIFKRLVHIIITVLVLVADSGQTIYARTCLKSNCTTVALVNKSCCHQNSTSQKSASFRKASCCRINSIMAKQAMPSRVQLQGPVKVLAPLFFVSGIFDSFVPNSPIVTPKPAGSAPEPLRTADILFTQVFRC